MRSPTVDATRRRIIDAAVDLFGREGFDAGLRAIGAAAGVSAAGVLKHFGAKEALRAACDDRVLAEVARFKLAAVRSADLGSTLLEQMARLEEFEPLVRYYVRSLMTGGEMARRMVEDMTAAAASWMREGVASGLVRPSRDEPARLRLAHSISIGWMIQAVLTSDKELGELGAEDWRRIFDDITLPVLELYTEGLLADRSILDTYLAGRTGGTTGPPADRPTGDSPTADDPTAGDPAIPDPTTDRPTTD